MGMASVRKRQRRKRRETGQAMEVDAQEKEDSVKSPDCVERLARKYMQKCTVESSTESESEARAEVVPSPLAGGLKKAKESRGLQFLDPYDGDSEDASVHTDCGIKDAPWPNSASKAMPLENADTSEDERSFPNPPNVSDIQAVNYCREALEFPGLEQDLLQTPEPPPATEAFTPMGLTSDHALPMAVNPSFSADLPAIPADTAPQPLFAAPSDGTMAEQPIIKRKRRISAPEDASEKLKRKKFRAT
ncbi:uncharacterized protein LOC111929808 isoform X1 [Cyanistes caeruleus]|uniref:uncharacterized protein LOC111929808 isoform X1 n=2 Tax=Cyanistes caeruleus TaxID=156563 RepID=UPI000CDA9CCB|nr:uncharacterized protein LOC111929808 isoform X1 [Cyanistes caeruleus]